MEKNTMTVAFAVCSIREYENGERYYGADAIFFDFEKAKEHVLASMKETLDETFEDADLPTVDWDAYSIRSGSTFYGWKIQSINIPYIGIRHVLLYQENSDAACTAFSSYYQDLDNAKEAMRKDFEAQNKILHFPPVCKQPDLDDGESDITLVTETSIYVRMGIDTYSWEIIEDVQAEDAEEKQHHGS